MRRLRVKLVAGFALAPFLVAFVGTVKGSANPYTFWHYATAPEHVPAARDAIECAVVRWRLATCLPVDVSLDAHHWVRMVPPPTWGHMGGSWNSTRIKVREGLDADKTCLILTHEIGHTLSRSNAHTDVYEDILYESVHFKAPNLITAAALERVCAVRDCQCFNPEQAQ